MCVCERERKRSMFESRTWRRADERRSGKNSERRRRRPRSFVRGVCCPDRCAVRSGIVCSVISIVSISLKQYARLTSVASSNKRRPSEAPRWIYASRHRDRLLHVLHPYQRQRPRSNGVKIIRRPNYPSKTKPNTDTSRKMWAIMYLLTSESRSLYQNRIDPEYP